MWFVTRRRFEAELKAARAEADRQRGLREEAEKAAETAAFNRRQVLMQNAELDASVQRLTGRNKALSDRLEETQARSGFDKAHAQRTATRIARLQQAVAAARADAAKERASARIELGAELERAQRAHRHLDEQARVLQAANEADARELHDLRVNGATS